MKGNLPGTCLSYRTHTVRLCSLPRISLPHPLGHTFHGCLSAPRLAIQTPPSKDRHGESYEPGPPQLLQAAHLVFHLEAVHFGLCR